MSTRKKRKSKQFKGTSTHRTFYDRKVRKVGYSRVISISKIIPEDWAYIRMRVVNQMDGAIEVLFTKLMGREELTSVERTREGGE